MHSYPNPCLLASPGMCMGVTSVDLISAMVRKCVKRSAGLDAGDGAGRGGLVHSIIQTRGYYWWSFSQHQLLKAAAWFCLRVYSQPTLVLPYPPFPRKPGMSAGSWLAININIPLLLVTNFAEILINFFFLSWNSMTGYIDLIFKTYNVYRITTPQI